MEKKTGARIGYFFLALVPFVLFFVVNIGASIVAMLPRLSDILDALDTNDTDAYNQIITDISPTAVILTHITLLIIFGIWYLLCNKKIKENKFHFRWKIVLVAFVTALSMGFVSNTTSLIQEYFVPSVVEDFEEMAEISGLGVDILTIVSAIFIAPIGEEFLCRGVTLMYALKSMPFWAANGLQALIFAIMHMNWVQGTYAFIIGLFLGYAVKKYNSIIPAIIIHFFVNSIASVVTGAIFMFIPANMICIVLTSIIAIAVSVSSFVLIKTDKA